MTTLGLTFYLFRYDIMRTFSHDQEVIAIGVSSIIFVALFQFFDAMCVTYIHVLQAVGDTVWPLYANIVLCILVLVGGGAAIVHYWPDLGSQGIWALTGLYIALLGLSYLYRWRKGTWKKIQLLT